jgi:hypothetical protein
VFEHPRAPGAIIKVISRSIEAAMHGVPMSDRDVLENDAEMTAVLGVAGVGPRLLGCTRIQEGSGEWFHSNRRKVRCRYAALKERVYGSTLTTLFRERRFDIRRLELVLDMLELMADRGLTGDDLQPSNIMIGTTLADARERAWLTDREDLVCHPSGTDPQRLRRALIDQLTAIRACFHPENGTTTVSKLPLKVILHNGLLRSQEPPGWPRLRRYFIELFESPVWQMPRR